MRIFLTLVILSVSVSAHSQLSAEKYIALARGDLQTQNYSLAIQRLNFAIRTKPYSVEAYFLRATAKYNLEDFQGAVIDYSHSLMLSPNNPAVYQNRGLARARMGDHYAAIEDYEKSIKYDPGNYFSYINMSYSLLQTNQYERAVQTCDRAITLNKFLDSGYLIRGMAYAELKKNKEAIADYTQALGINPQNSEAHLRRALAYNDNLDYVKAIQDCDSAIALDSASSLGYFVKANIYAERLEYEKALDNYDQVIKLSPHNAMAYFNRANVEARVDKLDKAAYDYGRVTEINPENILGHFNLALTLHKLGRYNLAVKSYDKVIELYPDYEDAYFNRAFAKREMGDEAGAQADFFKGNEIRGKNRMKEYDIEEEELLKRYTKMDADFYRPNFTEEEEQIAIYTFPFFEVKEVDYRRISNKNLYYNIQSLTTFNEEHNNLPFFYLTHHLLDEEEDRPSQISPQNNPGEQPQKHVWLKQAVDYRMQFNFNEALATYDSIILAYPDFGLAYFNKASTMLELLELMLKLEAGTGKFVDIGEHTAQTELRDVQTMNVQLNQMEELYLKAAELDPAFYFAWFNIGIVRAEKKEFEESIEAYTRVIKVNSQFAEAYYNRGLTYLYLKNTKKACNDLSKAGELGIKDAYIVMKKYCN